MFRQHTSNSFSIAIMWLANRGNYVMHLLTASPIVRTSIDVTDEFGAYLTSPFVP